MMRRYIFLILLTILSSCKLTRYAKIPETDYLTFSFDLQGRERFYYIHTPNNQTIFSGKLPLLLVLHGRFGSGKQIMEQAGFNELSNTESFLVVYPDGFSRSWADGRGKSPADKEKVDDVMFLEMVVSDVKSKFPVDMTRVYMAGHSNGGFMTQRMLFEKSDLFRGGVSVAAQISLYVVKNFKPISPISVAIMAGTEDPLVPYYGGYVRDGGEILSVEDSIQRWKTWNGCTNEKQEQAKDDFQDETSLDIITYPDCKANSLVRLYRVNGGGHAWPGQEQKIPFIKMGRPTQELNATTEIWSFFKSLEK